MKTTIEKGLSCTLDKYNLSVILEKLNNISNKLYNERIDRVEASYEVDEVIDEVYNVLKGL